MATSTHPRTLGAFSVHAWRKVGGTRNWVRLLDMDSTYQLLLLQHSFESKAFASVLVRHLDIVAHLLLQHSFTSKDFTSILVRRMDATTHILMLLHLC